VSTLGSRLRKLRNSKRWTMEEVANKLGLKTHSTYSNWEYDRTQPDIEMLVKLADLFKVSVDYLLGKQNEDFVYPESEIERVITETEKHYGVILRDDPVVYEAMRQLILGIAKAKKDQQS